MELNEKQRRFLDLKVVDLNSNYLVDKILSLWIDVNADLMYSDPENKTNFNVLFNINAASYIIYKTGATLNTTCDLRVIIRGLYYCTLDLINKEIILCNKIVNLQQITYNKPELIYYKVINNKHTILTDNVLVELNRVKVILLFTCKLYANNVDAIHYFMNGFLIDIADPRILISQHGMLLFYTPSKFMRFSTQDGFKISGFLTTFDLLAVLNNIRLGTNVNSITTISGTLYYNLLTLPLMYDSDQSGLINVLVVDRTNGLIKYVTPSLGGIAGVTLFNRLTGNVNVFPKLYLHRIRKFNTPNFISLNNELLFGNLKYKTDCKISTDSYLLLRGELNVDINIDFDKPLDSIQSVNFVVNANDLEPFTLNSNVKTLTLNNTNSEIKLNILLKYYRQTSAESNTQISYQSNTIEIKYYDLLLIASYLDNLLTTSQLIINNLLIPRSLLLKLHVSKVLTLTNKYLYIAVPVGLNSYLFFINCLPIKLIKKLNTISHTNLKLYTTNYDIYCSELKINGKFLLLIKKISVLDNKFYSKLKPLSPDIKLIDSIDVLLNSLTNNYYFTEDIILLQSLSLFIDNNSLFKRNTLNKFLLISEQQESTNMLWDKLFGLTITGKLLISENLIVKGKILLYSDIRLKLNIKTIKNYNKLYLIKPVKYNFKDNTELIRYGVIAQQILLLFPELVVSDGEYKTVNYLLLIPIMIKAIQLLKKLINKREI